MFYTSKSVKLHNRCLSYLELINKSQCYAENKKSDLKAYDSYDKKFGYIYPRSNYVDSIERWENLSEWLENRYNIAFTELVNERSKQLLKKTPYKIMQS